MKNSEVFRQYSSEKWVIEENLCFLLREYWETYGKKALEQAKNGHAISDMPYNPVSFVKKFMEEETFCDIGFAEQSSIATLENNVVSVIEDVDFIDLK